MHTAWLSAGYEVVSVSQYNSLTTRSPSGEDKYPVISAGYTYDTRDLQEYPSHGTYLSATMTKFGLPGNDVDIVRYAADIRKYIALNSTVVLTARVMSNLAAAGPTPSYNRVYFGYDERIRGHFNEVMEGESMAGAFVECHYTLLSPRYFNVDDLPSEFGVWRFGIVATAFGDAGTAWFRSRPFALNVFAKGYGVGLAFLLPYSTVVQTEYALNEVRRGEFILDAGISF